MRVNVIFVLASATILVPPSLCYPSKNIQPQNVSSGTSNSKFVPLNHQPITSKLDELTNQRTESIRHIIAAEQKTQERVTGLSNVSNHGKKVEKSLADIDEERFPTLEELRAKCQHYSRLFGNSDISERHASTVLPPRSEYYNRPVVEVTRRPVYIRNKPTFIEKNHGGFYVTTSSTGNEITTTKKNPYWTSSSSYPSSTYSPNFYNTRYTTSTTTSGTTSATSPITENSSEQVSTTEKPKIKIRYTKYEPVILQKTILTDGRVLYHWHKSLPTTAIDLPAPISPIATPILSTFELPSNVVPAVVPLPTRNFAPVEPMTEPTTTTTTERSSWLFVPFSGLFGGSHEEESSTVESTTATPSTTTTTTTTVASRSPLDFTTEEVKLQEQLKFVVPINYDEIDKTLAAQNKPWDYNRFDYSEGQRGQDTAPQQPNYQVIKTLAIPPTVPRYTLGYAGSGYGLYSNGGPYGGYGNTYGAGYGNYQGYDREDRRFDIKM